MENKNTNKVLTSTFFIGVYPGITEKMIDYIEKTVDKFFYEYNILEGKK